MNPRLPHLGKLTLFTLLSALDLVLTYYLVEQTGGVVYESNPIAGAWLSQYGWRGLAVYKVCSVGLVSGAALYVSCSRPRVGGSILSFGCVMACAVVLYSCSLARSFSAERNEESLEAARTVDCAAADQAWMRRSAEYHRVLVQLADEWQAGRFTAMEAARQLLDTEKGRDLVWRAHVHRVFGGGNDQEAFAIHFLRFVQGHQGKRPVETAPFD